MIVLIPGLDGCTSFFTDVTPELTSGGYDVMVFSLPLAPSPFDEPTHASKPYNFDFIADTLQEVRVAGVVCVCACVF